jgi:tRNA nucleotidyltransferase (CCA-adding enzyme)
MDYSNFKIDMPNDVEFIINTIKSHGHQAYAVGGCVRDSIMGLTPNDWDITTSALPSDIKEYFNKTIDTGIEHGTVTVMLHNVGYEVTTYRIDGEYKDGRHPSSVEFSDRLTDDLCRRDFTINAMAYNNVTGLVDEYGGIDDINNRIIKCVGNPIERFTEDALRMMRAIRFSAQLGFTIDEATWNAIKKLSPSISKISMERVHVELGKTLMSAHPDYVAQYSEAGLFAPILPVIDNALKSRYKRKILATLQHTPDNIYLRYAALFITSTPDEAAKTLRALKLDNKTVNTVSKLVELSKMDIEETEPAVRTALNKYGRDFLPLWHELMMAVIQASEDITGISNPAKVKHLLTLKRLGTDILARGDCFTIKDLDISGNDLIEYGLQGHEIGETLKSLLDIVIENPKLNDKATLIAMIEHIK